MDKPARREDPSRALDGLVQRLAAGWRRRQPAAAQTAPTASGFEDTRPSALHSDFHSDRHRPLPELNLPRVDPSRPLAGDTRMPWVQMPPVRPPNPDAGRTLADDSVQATVAAAAMWLADARARQLQMPELSLQGVHPRPPPHPRVLGEWRRGAWIGARLAAVAPTTELIQTENGPQVQAYPTQHLVVLWSPAWRNEPHLGRWPRLAYLSTAAEAELDASVLAHVPDEAPLWWLPAASQRVDWALAADIVLLHETALRPFQAQALRELIGREREAAEHRKQHGYHQPSQGAPIERRD